MKTKELMKNLSHICEVKVGYFPKINPSEVDKLTSSKDVEAYIRPFFEAFEIYQKEYFAALYLNRQNKPLGILKISEGTATGTIVDVQYLMRGAILTNAQAIILAHNHPSGNMQPSQADIDLTKKIVNGCKLLDLHCLDHLILNPFGGYYSFADEGQI